MALITADRVREFTSTNGTGAFTLTGAAVGYQTFGSAIGSGNTCYYAAYNPGINEWEVGIGTVGSGTLARTTVLKSSNANNLVDFSAGTKDVFVTYPAEYAVFQGGAFSGTTVTSGQVDITSQGDLRLQDTTGGQYVALQAPGTVPASYTLTLPDTDGDAGQALVTDGSGVLSWSTAASGDVYGPASATDNAVARFDGTTGKLIQNSVFTIADDGASVLSVNSASNGLRITQTGAGNALVVEDSANPDATPFVVDANGYAVIGNNLARSAYSVAGLLQTHSTSALTGTTQGYLWSADGNPVIQTFAKSRGSTVGTQTIVNNGDELYRCYFTGSDGVGFIPAAQIGAFVDGTPGTNDMPGRLVFSTTADGASGPTERMRIDNAGRVGIGSNPDARSTLTIGGTAISSGAESQVVRVQTIIPSTSTTDGRGYQTFLSTQAAAFTLGELTHFLANQSTIGAGSTVTNQYGFNVSGNLTGATNNYGFYGNIASGTGRYNFYAAGSADNYFAGKVGIGTATPSTDLHVYSSGVPVIRLANPSVALNTYVDGSFAVTGTITNSPYIITTNNTERMRIDSAGRIGIGGTNTGGAYGNVSNQIPLTGATSTSAYGAIVTINSDVTAAANVYKSQPTTQAAAFTLAGLNHYSAEQYGFGAGSTVTNQYGFHATSSLTGATNNYGVYSNLASGTGRYNFYAAGSAANYFGGDVVTNGKILNGSTSSVIAITYPSQIQTNSWYAAQFALWSADSIGANSFYLKSRSGTVGTHTVLQANDQLGSIVFAGSDGTSFIQSVNIAAYVDGTPGTNDMPGRLVFSTTADGASSPTERMRIDGNGNVGIGGTSYAGSKLQVLGTLPAAGGNCLPIAMEGTVPSTATASVQNYRSVLNTAAASFTASSVRHFSAWQGTIGAGSTVTTQTGFEASSTLTGATNNYGFYSNIASGIGRYNFYAAGSADNYFAGNVGIGTTSLNPLGTSSNLALYGSASTSITLRANSATGGYLSTDGTSYVQLVAQASAANLLLGTNNTERMRIDSAGNVGIGGTPSVASLYIAKSITGATAAQGIYQNPTIQSDVTNTASIYLSNPNTAAAAFTLGALPHYRANQGTIGAGSSVGTQYGFIAESTLTGATNNYGFYGNIASGIGRYNFYAAGTADNYFSGRVGIGATPGASLDVSGVWQNGVGIARINASSGQFSGLTLQNAASAHTYFYADSVNNITFLGATSGKSLVFATNTGGTDNERMRIDSSGNVIQSAPTTAPTLATNGTMVFNLTSNTNLRVSVRGSDGVTRTANITLA